MVNSGGQRLHSLIMSDGPFYDFGQVDRFLVGAVGEPGERTFYIFIESGGLGHWFKCEKGQAAALGEQTIELLNSLEWEIDDDQVEAILSGAPALPAPSPGDVLFPVNTIAMRIDQENRLTFVLGGDEGQGAVFAVTAEQMRAMSVKALEAVHSGREECQNCLLPMNPGGHECPSSNGHRTTGG